MASSPVQRAVLAASLVAAAFFGTGEASAVTACSGVPHDEGGGGAQLWSIDTTAGTCDKQIGAGGPTDGFQVRTNDDKVQLRNLFGAFAGFANCVTTVDNLTDIDRLDDGQPICAAGGAPEFSAIAGPQTYNFVMTLLGVDTITYTLRMTITAQQGVNHRVTSFTISGGAFGDAGGGADPGFSERAVEGLAIARGRASLTEVPAPGAFFSESPDDKVQTAFYLDAQSVDGATALSFDGDLTLRDDAAPFGFWAKASGHFLSDDTGAFDVDSAIGLAQVGGDVRLSDRVRVGVMAQGDIIDQSSNATATASGVGFMAGPYFAAEIIDGAHLFGHAMAGRAFNTLAVTGASDTDYDSDRLQLALRLDGDYAYGRLRVRPSGQVGYYAERTNAFRDGAGTTIDSGVDSLFQVQLGPEFAYDLLTDGRTLRPFVGTSAVYNAATGRAASPSAADAADGFSASAEAGLEVALRPMRLRAEVGVDGIGADDFSGVRGAATFRVPFN